MNPFLSIIVPVYNEEKRLIDGLKTIADYFDQQDYQYEVIIINNGSKDSTEVLAQDFIGPRKNWQILTIPRPAKGLALKTGFIKSQGEYILLTDIDIPVDFSQIPKFINSLKEHDIAIASKYLAGSRCISPIPTSRKIASHMFNRLTKLILGLPFADTQCGFKLFKRHSLLSLINNLRISGLGFDVEILYQARKQNLKIVELPVVWENRESSKISLPGASIKMFGDLIRIGLK